MLAGMSLEAGNRRKAPVTLAVTAGYFFSLKKIMRENLSSINSLSEMCRTVGPDRQFLVRTGKILCMPDRLTGNYSVICSGRYILLLINKINTGRVSSNSMIWRCLLS